MARRSNKRVADATTKLGRTIAEALRSWAQEVGADDLASDVMDRVREGFDVVLDSVKEATGKAGARAKAAARRQRGPSRRSRRRCARKSAALASGRRPARRQRRRRRPFARQAEPFLYRHVLRTRHHPRSLLRDRQDRRRPHGRGVPCRSLRGTHSARGTPSPSLHLRAGRRASPAYRDRTARRHARNHRADHGDRDRRRVAGPTARSQHADAPTEGSR